MSKFLSQFIVLSAPSGAGKTTIAKLLARRHPEMEISVSATTRSRRKNEHDGKEYFFLTESEFLENISKQNFLEYEEVHGDYYGTLKNKVEELKQNGKVILFDIDVKGALSIKKKYPESVLIFIKAPSIKELKNRLKNRKSETEEAIQRRLKRINYEYAQADKFDHIVINDNLNRTIAFIEELIIA